MKRKTIEKSVKIIIAALFFGTILLGLLAWQNNTLKKERDEKQFLYEDTVNFFDSITKGIGMLSQARTDYSLGFFQVESDCDTAKKHFFKANQEFRAAAQYFVLAEKNTYTEAYQDFALKHQRLTSIEFNMNKELYNNCGKTEKYEELRINQNKQLVVIYGDALIRAGDAELAAKSKIVIPETTDNVEEGSINQGN